MLLRQLLLNSHLIVCLARLNLTLSVVFPPTLINHGHCDRLTHVSSAVPFPSAATWRSVRTMWIVCRVSWRRMRSWWLSSQNNWRNWKMRLEKSWRPVRRPRLALTYFLIKTCCLYFCQWKMPDIFISIFPKVVVFCSNKTFLAL